MIKNTKVLTVLGTVALIFIGLLGSLPVAALSIHPVFESILPQLQRSTHVPLKLPQYLADEGNPPLIAEIQSLNQSEYNLFLGFIKGCDGRNVCHYGSVSGKKIDRQTPIVKGETTFLTEGIKGVFKDTVCQVYCGESSLTWQQNDYQYSIGIKAGSKPTLIEIVNSALTRQQD